MGFDHKTYLRIKKVSFIHCLQNLSTKVLGNNYQVFFRMKYLI